MNITFEQFAQATECPTLRAQRWYEPLKSAMPLFGIDTAQRVAMFLANLAHESGRFVYSKEIWGPTPAQRGYEGRRDLGNTEMGDGKRYMGRGPIQVTGRSNYAAAYFHLAAFYPNVPNFEALPETLEDPLWGARAACEFWYRNKINRYADLGDFDGTCDAVNRGRKTAAIGDANGYADRLKLYKSACAAFGVAPV